MREFSNLVKEKSMTVQPIQLELGLQVIQSYKRLSYTPWHAIAELVDNATQSYFDNRAVLDESLSKSGEEMVVGIVYERANGGLLRVSDNAMGMSYLELANALRVGFPPKNTSGRSKYGMGMKTASCWIGNKWTVRTKKLGDTQEHRVTIDVNRIAGGDNDLKYQTLEGKLENSHYTVIEIRDHNQIFQGRTIGKIKDFLRSIYRQDLRNNWLTIEWQGSALEWSDNDLQFLEAPDGSPYRKKFKFDVCGKSVNGWVGVLSSGSRSKAGFSILHADRVVKGWPESWRPEAIYGFQGRNDLINQRLVGEIYLDQFDVSHTKDDILWYGDELEQVENLLKEECADYVAVARKPYGKSDDDPDGPTDVEVQTALDALQGQLSSDDFSDTVTLDDVPPPQAILQALRPLKQAVSKREPHFQAKFEDSTFEVLGYLVNDSSVNDPYVVVEATNEMRVLIIINTQHPHWGQLLGSEGVLNYLRHCTYDGVAEWKARRKSASLDPDTIKVLKDGMLRLSLDIEEWTEDVDDQA